MEAVEFIRQKDRMCDYYSGRTCTHDESGETCPAMSIDCEITTDELEQLVAIVEKWAKEHPVKPKQERREPEQEQKYIVRADRAGVFFGEIESRTGSEVTMRNVRRIWRWEGANSLSQLAVDGTRAGNMCKFSVAVESMTILGVIEIIPCTAKATKSISEVPEWRF